MRFKGGKWRYIGLCLGVFACLLFNFGYAKNSYAIDFDETGTSNITSCTILIGTTNLTGTIVDGGCTFFPTATGWTNRMIFDLSVAIPGKSIITITGRYSNDATLSFVGLGEYNNLVKLSEQTSLNTTNNQMAFTAIYYTQVPLNSIRLEGGQMFFVNSGQVRVDIQSIGFITLTDEPTRNQINEIKNNLNTTNGNLEIIRENIKTIIENSQKTAEKDDQDRTNIETQQTDTNETTSDAEKSTNQATSSLIDTMTSVIGAITGASARSSCVLSGKLNDAMGENFSVDFCALDPPPALIAILNIPMALVIFGLCRSLYCRLTNEIEGFTH